MNRGKNQWEWILEFGVLESRFSLNFSIGGEEECRFGSFFQLVFFI